jgi:hypothetical protein
VWLDHEADLADDGRMLFPDMVSNLVRPPPGDMRSFYLISTLQAR